MAWLWWCRVKQTVRNIRFLSSVFQFKNILGRSSSVYCVCENNLLFSLCSIWLQVFINFTSGLLWNSYLTNSYQWEVTETAINTWVLEGLQCCQRTFFSKAQPRDERSLPSSQGHSCSYQGHYNLKKDILYKYIYYIYTRTLVNIYIY